MSDDVKCDRCVDLVHPPANCRECEIEREVAAAVIPDHGPRVVDLAQVEAEGAALADRWKQFTHPVEVAASIRALLSRTDRVWTTLVARIALDEFVGWLTYDCPIEEQRTRSRLILPVLRILRELTPPTPEATPITPRRNQ